MKRKPKEEKRKAKRKFIYLLNGPNLNLLGRRNPKVYGKATLEDIVKKAEVQATALGYTLVAEQTNSEEKLLAFIQQAPDHNVAGIILNAGGLTTPVCVCAMRWTLLANWVFRR